MAVYLIITTQKNRTPLMPMGSLNSSFTASRPISMIVLQKYSKFPPKPEFHMSSKSTPPSPTPAKKTHQQQQLTINQLTINKREDKENKS